MIRKLCTLACVLSIVANLSGSTARAQAPKPPLPAAGDVIYVPLPPRFVAGPMVSQAKWSPDGRYVLAVAEDIDLRVFPLPIGEPPHPVSAAIWNASTRRVTTVWSDNSLGAQIEQVEWLSGASISFIIARWTDETGSTAKGLWRIDARRAAAVKIEGFTQSEVLFVSPSQPCAFLIGRDSEGSYLKPLAATGSIGLAVHPQAGTFATGEWTQDGRSLILLERAIPLEDVAPTEQKTSWRLCDARTGAITTLNAAPKPYIAPVRKYAFKVGTTPVSMPASASAPMVRGMLTDWGAHHNVLMPTSASAPMVPWGSKEINMAWLEQGAKPSVERLLIAAQADRTEISPAGDAILYVNSEGAFIVGLLKAPKALVEQSRTAAQRTQVLNNGKQLALAVIMWAKDNDENLPPAGSGMPALLEAYARDKAIFDPIDGQAGGFVYTLNGGLLSGVLNPAGTMMGYVPGPGGFAVAYADGHVQWSSTLPSPPPEK
jgi:prepilin-type processing-associated H-X9-DG protein